ncbi:beta-lactamase-like protein [Cladorrhinum samala]|uniref:Beta-lactamase-like protein n=1 Tax=Cladorrhinum samala TaxID=585594 RepID=A0AAV9HTU1_9PEZI|nr:beta-lactamase-like protein [Cladorrhinum samala]
MRPLLALLLRTSSRCNSVPKRTFSRMASPSLPPIAETTALSPSLIRILAGNPGKFSLQGTNTYLLGTGPSRLLIDTGEGKPSWIQALKRTLAEQNASLQAALITHWHGDHTGGIPDLLQHFPNLPVYKNQTQNHPNHDPSRIKFHDIENGQEFSVPGATLTAFLTPGHTTDHVVFRWREEDALFTGDNVLGHGTAVFEDLSTYLASLIEMKGLFGGKAYPGHGVEIEDGRGKIEEYLRHRKGREDQVVQRLRGLPPSAGGVGGEVVGKGSAGTAAGWTLMELVMSIYKDVPEALHLAAAGGLAQILQKLQGEGKAVCVDAEDGEERWRLVASSAREAAL